MILGRRILNSFMLFVLIGFNTIRMPNNNILIPGEDQTGSNPLVLSTGGEQSYLETDNNLSAREANPGLTPPLSGDAPGVTNPGNQTNNEGTEINLQILASDPEEDPLAYSATGLPGGLSIDPSSGLISGTISYTASSGSVYSVRVTVTDSGDPVNSTDADFTWTVNDINGPPEVSVPDDQISSEGSSIFLQIEATDPEGNELSYSAGNLPGDLVIDEGTGEISGTINYDAAASSPYTVTVYVMDDGDPNETTQIQFSWEVENTNRAPELTNPGTKTNAEAESISFTPSASDPDGNTLTYSAANLPQGLSINSSSGEISGVISYTASQVSPYSVTITVHDDGSPVLQAQETFTWAITDVNGQPVVTNPGNKSNNEGDTVSFSITATDPDEDELTFSASNLPDGLSIDPGSGEISGTVSYTASVTSPYSVIVYAEDGGSPNLQGQTSFTWTINDVNGAPEVTTPPNQSDAEGDVVSLSISATDPDGDDLTYSATNLPGGVSIDSGSGLISGTISYSAADSSPYSVTVTVEDDGVSAQQTQVNFTWTVDETNRAPQVTDPPDQEDAENETVSLQIVATDPDGDDLTYSASNLPDGLSINESSGLISGTVSYSAGGSSPYTVLITVEDDGSPVMQEQISILWTITNVNRQPQLDALENQSSSEGQVVSLSVTATDPDGDGLTYSATNLPDGLSINPGSGVISGTISYSASASSPYSVTVTVVDNGTPALQDDAVITWTVSDTNQAPDVDTPPDQSDAEGDVVSLQITATDPDGHNLSYSASNLPDGLSIAETTGLISGTIAYTAHASSPFSVFVTVTDDGSPSKFSQVSFSWTVADTNQAPTITNPGNRSSAEGAIISLQITAADLDGNNLTYSAVNLPDGLSINPGSGLISGTISYTASLVSPYSVTVTVVDDGSPVLQDQASFTWTVTDVNGAPQVDNLGEQTDAEGDEISLSITASDPDGDDLTYSASNLPGGLSINPTSGLISGTISYTASAASPYDVTLTVTDSGSPAEQDQTSFYWYVTNTNQNPQITNPGPQTSLEGAVISLSLTASDPDSDTLTWSANNLPDGLSIDVNTGVISGTISYTAHTSSPYEVTITVIDNGSPPMQDQEIFNWEVTDVNGAPQVTNPGSQSSAEGAVISLQITANDPDGDTLTYSASNLPDGLSINPGSGLISGTISQTASENSPYNVVITVTDNGTPSEQGQTNFTWTVSNTNQTPDITNPGEQNSVEGAVIELQITAADLDGDDLTYSASGLPSGLSINENNGLISGTISYTASISSPYEVSVTVTDDGTPNLQDQAVFTWNVTDTNRAPQVTDPGNQSSAEGAVVSLQIEASDPDGNSLTYSASGLPGGLGINSGSGLISGTVSLTAADNSPYSVVVTVTDNGSPVLQGQTSFSWVVSDTNRTPQVTDPGDQSSAEGTVVSLQIEASDPDGDILTYSASGLPDGLSIGANNGLISGTISYNAYSPTPYNVVITATDNGTPILQGQTSFTWTVTDNNRAPNVTNPGEQTSAEGVAVELQVAASDLDGDELIYSASNLPDGLSINDETGLITGTISYTAHTGSPYEVTITVTDDGTSPLQTQVNFDWNVTDVNGAPQVTNPGNQTSAEESVISLQISASDPDGDTLTYTASGLPGGLSIDSGSGLISGTISNTAAESSPYSVIVTTTDNGTPAQQSQASFTWTVSNTNQAPDVTNPGEQTSAEGTVIELQITASDPDGNGITFAASGLPDGLSIDENNGLISGTLPYTAHTGSPYEVTVTVSDDVTPSLQTQVNFNWNVTDVNGPPQVTNPGNQTSAEEAVISLQISASDPDGGDTLTYSASGLPNGLSINTNSGLISGTIANTAAESSPYSVIVTATDNGTPAQQGQASFTWTVSNTNQAPDVTNPGDQTSAEGAVIELQITASDPDGNGITFAASGLPDGLSIDENNGLISGTLLYTAHTGSPYEVTVTVSDDVTPSLQTQVNFDWNVTDVNGPPQVTNPGNQTSAEEAVISLQISASDPDGGDTLTYSASGLPDGLSINTNSGLISGTIANTAAESSPYSVIVTATDNGTPAQQGQASFTWTITNTNRAPDVTNPGEQTSAEGAVISLQIDASDLDGDTLTYAASDLPEGLSINPATGLISGTVSYDASSSSPYEVTITVTDGGSPQLQDQAVFDWVVNDTNRAPEGTDPGDQSSAEGAVISLQIEAEDLDGDTLTYSAAGLPDELSINTNTGLISGTISYDAYSSSPYSITITILDGGSPELQDQIEFDWTITNTNRAPEVDDPGEQTNAEGAEFSLQILASDPDEDGLTYSATGLPAGYSIDSYTGLISGCACYYASANSPYDIQVTVLDSGTPQQSEVINFEWNISDSTPSSLWYLAEGYTGSGFSTYILIQNPNVDTAYITVTYMLDSGTNIVRLISVPGNSRYTIETHNADQVGPDAAFATKLESSKPVFVERAMYWPNGSGSSGGHDTEGVKQANTTWYLAEGYTGAGFQTFILIQNPNSSNATITVTYMLEDGSTVERIISVLANSRYTIAVQNEDQLGWDQAFSTKLVSDRPVVVERSMYFSNDGHVSKGVVSPQTTWYLAEGFSGANYNTFILVQNPGLVDANVSVTYMLSDGTIEERNLVVLAQSRYTIAAHESSQVGLDQAFSTQVVADQPIIVERAMYWPNGEGTLGGHGSPGVNSPASTWYLAEGYTGNGTNTFVLLQNPSSTSAQVAVTYMLQGGGVIERIVTVPAKSRYTIETHSSEQVGVDQAFSTKLVSTQPVIVERSMYFNNGGHGAVGVNE